MTKGIWMKAADKTPKIRLGKPGDYPRLLSEIKERIRSAQYEALKAVNKELVGLYWDIGRMIVARQADAEHGSAIAERLSKDLRAEFPGISGFSRRNVFYMREFYLLYRDDERVQPLVAQIGWSHNLVILRRLHCLVAIDLKIGEFQPEFVGKMQFYLTALDRQVRQEDENPTIGIILCKEKNRTVVEYALHDARKPMGVATYEITRTLPKSLKGQLPSPKEITKLMEDL